MSEVVFDMSSGPEGTLRKWAKVVRDAVDSGQINYLVGEEFLNKEIAGQACWSPALGTRVCAEGFCIEPGKEVKK